MRGVPFKSGHSKRGGRKPGARNRSTTDVGAICRALVNDPVYRANLEQRMQAGKLAPGVEQMAWHYAYGKPPETVNLEGKVDLRTRVVHEYLDASEDVSLGALHPGAQ